MRGIFIRDASGGTNQVFFGNARQLLVEHGPDAKFVRYEDDGSPYTGEQPSDVVKGTNEADPEGTKARREEQRALDRQANMPRGQMAVQAAANAAKDPAPEEGKDEPPQEPTVPVENVAPPSEPPVLTNAPKGAKDKG